MVANITRYIREPRGQEEGEKKKQKTSEKKKAAGKKTQPPGSVTATTEPHADAETHQVEQEASEVEAERSEKTENDKVVSEAWIKANEARTSAEKAVQRLKSLRIKGNAGSEEISAARKKIESKMKKAMKLEIAAIFAEDDLHEPARGETAAVDDANVFGEEGYDSPLVGFDNESLGSFHSPPPQPEAPLIAPEMFPLPTPAPTISSPTTGPVSPVKEDVSTGQGTQDEPVDVEENETSWAAQVDFDRKLGLRYESALAAGDPLADLIAEHVKFLSVNGKASVNGVNVTEFTLMQLFERVWLDDDIVNLYAELLVQGDPRFQVIHSRTITWELTALNRPGGPIDDCPYFDLEPNTMSFLIPTFVNGNHWMLCVARFPDADGGEGTLDWYNSLQTSTLRPLCEESARDVVRVLLWFATVPGSRLKGVSWVLNECQTGHQRNSDDCGVFVDATAAAVVLDAPIPQDVDGFRVHIASQVAKAARSESLDWTAVKDVLTAAAGDQTTLGGAKADDESPDEDMKDEEAAGDEDEEIAATEEAGGEAMETTDYLCDICWYHYASSPATLATHKSAKHNTEPFICEWPGCRAVMADQETLDAHHRHVHERKTYFCPVRICHRRFVTENDWWEHVTDQHPEAEEISPHILDERYRTFDMGEMRAAREKARAIWGLKCGSEDKEHAHIAKLYAAYHSLTPREYYDQKGVLGQNFDADPGDCRTISRLYAKANPGETRPKQGYGWRYREGGESYVMGRAHGWWLMFLHQKEGSELDKFVNDAVLGGSWVEISHKCHWAFCFVISHLEQVMPRENSDRSVCKNRSRSKDGGCNALQSLHPHDHCFLDMPEGTPFDIELAPPLPKTTTGSKRKATSRTGPCVYGHTTTDSNTWLPHPDNNTDSNTWLPHPDDNTDSNTWLPHPDDNTQNVCRSCYMKIKRGTLVKGEPTRKPRLQTRTQTRTRTEGPCVNGHTTTNRGGWYRDPNDKKRVLCNMCYVKVRRENKQKI